MADTSRLLTQLRKRGIKVTFGKGVTTKEAIRRAIARNPESAQQVISSLPTQQQAEAIQIQREQQFSEAQAESILQESQSKAREQDPTIKISPTKSNLELTTQTFKQNLQTQQAEPTFQQTPEQQSTRTGFEPGNIQTFETQATGFSFKDFFGKAKGFFRDTKEKEIEVRGRPGRETLIQRDIFEESSFKKQVERLRPVIKRISSLQVVTTAIPGGTLLAQTKPGQKAILNIDKRFRESTVGNLVTEAQAEFAIDTLKNPVKSLLLFGTGAVISGGAGLLIKGTKAIKASRVVGGVGLAALGTSKTLEVIAAPTPEAKARVVGKTGAEIFLVGSGAKFGSTAISKIASKFVKPKITSSSIKSVVRQKGDISQALTKEKISIKSAGKEFKIKSETAEVGRKLLGDKLGVQRGSQFTIETPSGKTITGKFRGKDIVDIKTIEPLKVKFQTIDSTTGVVTTEFAGGKVAQTKLTSLEKLFLKIYGKGALVNPDLGKISNPFKNVAGGKKGLGGIGGRFGAITPKGQLKPRLILLEQEFLPATTAAQTQPVGSADVLKSIVKQISLQQFGKASDTLSSFALLGGSAKGKTVSLQRETTSIRPDRRQSLSSILNSRLISTQRSSLLPKQRPSQKQRQRLSPLQRQDPALKQDPLISQALKPVQAQKQIQKQLQQQKQFLLQSTGFTFNKKLFEGARRKLKPLEQPIKIFQTKGTPTRGRFGASIVGRVLRRTITKKKAKKKRLTGFEIREIPI